MKPWMKKAFPPWMERGVIAFILILVAGLIVLKLPQADPLFMDPNRGGISRSFRCARFDSGAGRVYSRRSLGHAANDGLAEWCRDGASTDSQFP